MVFAGILLSFYGRRLLSGGFNSPILDNLVNPRIRSSKFELLRAPNESFSVPGRGFFNPAVAVKLETRLFPRLGTRPRGAMLLFVLDTVIGTGRGQESEAKWQKNAPQSRGARFLGY